MKKSLATLALTVLVTLSAFSQDAIGVRLGGGYLGGGEVSYIKALNNNRLELDLGITAGRYANYGDRIARPTYFSLAGAYQWHWNIVEDLGWFVGPAVGLGLWHEKIRYGDYKRENCFGLSLGGQIGLDYDFTKLGAPLMVSLDFRPMGDFFYDGGCFNWGVCLGVRYVY